MKGMLPLGFVVGLALSLARVPVPYLSPAQTAALPTPVVSAAPTVTEALTEPLPTSPENATPTATAVPLEESTAVEPTEAADPSSTTVQVLDGAGDRVRAGDVVRVLEDLGYQVVASNPAAVEYTETTILYTAGHRAEAEALQARDPRFAAIRENENLSTEVDIHVVVGTDWPA